VPGCLYFRVTYTEESCEAVQHWFNFLLLDWHETSQEVQNRHAYCTAGLAISNASLGCGSPAVRTNMRCAFEHLIAPTMLQKLSAELVVVQISLDLGSCREDVWTVTRMHISMLTRSCL
jgi:hypothetical protein